MKHHIVALVLALLSSAASAQAPDLSISKLLSGDDAIGVAANDQEEPHLAAGGGGYLVVWTDLGTTENNLVPDQAARDVLAARLDASGNVIDTTPIPVATTFGDQSQPEVAWNGLSWLVTWENQSPTQFFYASAIQGARVAADGTLLDTTPIDILVYDFSSSVDYGLASDGQGWAVVAQGTSAGESDLVGVRVSSAGTVLDAGGKTLLSLSQLVLGIRVSFAVDTYVAIFSQTNRAKALRLDAALNKKTTQAVNVGPGTYSEVRPNVGTDGSDFFVVWEATSSTTAEDYIQGARFTRSGQVLDTGGLTFTSNGITSVRDPAVGWDGAQWVVLYRNHSLADGLDAVRVTTAGQILDFDGLELSMSEADQPAVVDDAASGVRLVWRDRRAQTFPGSDVYTRSLDPALGEGPETAVSLAAPSQVRPDVAAGPNEYLIAFESRRSGSDSVFVQRVDRFGNTLDDEPTLLASGTLLGAPQVAWNGTLYLVVWSDQSTGLVFGQRVDALGVAVDPVPFFVQPGLDPDVGSVGTQFLVVGWDDPSSVEVRNVYASRVDGDSGVVLDLGAPLLVGSSFANRPRVEGFSGRYLVTWQRNFTHDDVNADLRFVFVGTDGSSTSETILTSFAFSPDVAVGDDSALFVWHDSIGGSTQRDAFARRIDAAGNFLEVAPFVLSAATSDQYLPAGAWNGSEWVTTWADRRDEVSFFDERDDVFGARVDASGGVVDPSAFPILEVEDPATSPSVASLGNGTALVAQQHMRREAPYGSYRIELRVVGAWGTVGTGAAGTNGVPVLDGTGTFAVGETLEASVSGARANAAGILVYGFSRIDLPLRGATLIPFPDGLLGFTTDSNGTHTELAPILVPPLAGLTLFVQAWIFDSAGSQGFAVTPAVTTTAD